VAGEGTGMSDAGVAAARGQLQGGATQGSEAGSAGDNRRGSLPNGQDSGEAVALVRQATPDPRTDARQAAPRAPDAAVAGVGAWAVRDLEGGRVGESGVEAGAVARGGRRDQTLYLGETQQGRVEGLLGEVLAKLEMQDARIEGVKREMMLKMVGAWVRGCMCAWVQGFGCVGACVRGAWVRGCVGAWVRGCVGAWVRGCVGAWVCIPSISHKYLDGTGDLLCSLERATSRCTPTSARVESGGSHARSG